jgi:vacuolar-type H+-ATPase subunit E/Vma4
LLKQAKAESADDMVLRPAAVDRKALTKESSGYKIGDDIDGFGGFVLESSDGSVIMDYRFEGRLREAWSASLGEVSGILFGE